MKNTGSFKFLLLLAFLAAMASRAMALGTAEMQKCASIPGDSERLRCYDGLSRTMGIPTAGREGNSFTTQARYGKWTLRTEAAKTGGTASVFAYTFSDNPLRSQQNTGEKPLLVARCYQGVTEFFIEIPHPGTGAGVEGEPHGLHAVPAGQETEKDTGIIVIGGDSPSNPGRESKARLTYGNGMSVDLYLTPSEDKSAWFFPNPVSFISQVKRSAKITIEGMSAMPTGKMVFDLDGFVDALAPLRASCSW